MTSVGELLACGGDDRLTLNDQNVNKYFASTYPRPDIISRGSCTCSTVTQDTYSIAETFNFLSEMRVTDQQMHNSRQFSQGPSFQQQQQQHQDEVHTSDFSDIRDRIARVLRLNEVDSATDVVLFPSGSDAELLATSIALVRQHNLMTAKAAVTAETTVTAGTTTDIGSGTGTGAPAHTIPILNIVVAAGEIGSGTANAASGKHFSDISPTNSVCQRKDESLAGFDATDVELCLMKPRNEQGQSLVLQEYEARIASKLLEVMSQQPDRVCLLHLVCGSKTGLVYPSLHFAKQMVAKYPRNLLVVADCCQLRCHYTYLHECLAHGFMCLITGSKFFTGPPFWYVVQSICFVSAVYCIVYYWLVLLMSLIIPSLSLLLFFASYGFLTIAERCCYPILCHWRWRSTLQCVRINISFSTNIRTSNVFAAESPVVCVIISPPSRCLYPCLISASCFNHRRLLHWLML